MMRRASPADQCFRCHTAALRLSYKFNLEQLSIIIVLRNCSAECTSQFLKRIKLNYDHLLRLKVLKMIKPGVRHITTDLKSKYWENLTSYDPGIGALGIL